MSVDLHSDGSQPDHNCSLCPRLAEFRREAREKFPDKFNAPVPGWGDLAGARLLIVGLAPGLRGANFSGRPFTGDYAGDLLYTTMLEFGFARGQYLARIDDGLALIGCAVTNAVRCVPPQNKPLPAEIAQCRVFLKASLAQAQNTQAVLALGRIAHESFLRAYGLKLSAFAFAHGARHELTLEGGRKLSLFDSYHCSRYNTNTGVLTTEMFRSLFSQIRRFLA